MLKFTDDNEDLLGAAFALLHLEDETARLWARHQIRSIRSNFPLWCAAEAESPKIAKSRDHIDRAVGLAESLVAIIPKMIPGLGVGGATDEIVGQDPARGQEDEREQQALQAAWQDVRPNLEWLAKQTRERRARWDHLKRGRANVETMRHGPAKQRLVAHCFELFEQCRPGEATQSETGDFYCFCAAVYQIATGQGADEEGVGLKRYVERVVRTVRHR